MSRIDSARIGARKRKLADCRRCRFGCFLPFATGSTRRHRSVKAVIHRAGRYAMKVIAAANELRHMWCSPECATSSTDGGMIPGGVFLVLTDASPIDRPSPLMRHVSGWGCCVNVRAPGPLRDHGTPGTIPNTRAPERNGSAFDDDKEPMSTCAVTSSDERTADSATRSPRAGPSRPPNGRCRLPASSLHESSPSRSNDYIHPLDSQALGALIDSGVDTV
jgi:hypothetical protein